VWTGPRTAGRSSSVSGRKRQGGIVLILYVATALIMVGMAGMALDLGTAYVTRTRLQNAVDAAALDGAQSLARGLGTVAATANALSTFNLNATNIPNIDAHPPTILTSDSYAAPPAAFVSPGANPVFMKVSVDDFPVTTYLVNVFRSTNSMPVSASAIAGPQDLGAPCGLPIALCGDSSVADHDCTDGDCYGIPTVGGEVHLKSPASGTGFFGLLVTGAGVNGVNDALAGATVSCNATGATPTTQGGFAGSNTSALNTRFGTAVGTYNDPSLYPPDKVTTQETYSSYTAALQGGNWDHPSGQAGRRSFPLPIVDCSGSGASKPVTVLGHACFFMTQAVPTSGVDAGDVFGQMVPTCLSAGSGGTPGGSGGGAQRIVLYLSATAG
jgi:Flp pilus assembly protein TadG